MIDNTDHTVYFQDSSEIGSVGNNSVDLVVTSPPYPMIEMWDDMFSEMDEEIPKRLDDGDGERAFDLMHNILDGIWEEVDRVVSDNGIVCVNIGDATRKIGGSFKLFDNRSRISQKFRNMGFNMLPGIIWKKVSNSGAKFMGSGMLPTNQYVTLDHEHILVFRKGGTRSFSDKENRGESGYFFWERNEWFSDIWEGVTGDRQNMDNKDVRDRSAAYPLEIPYRLINMYSVYGDTVLDPFWGTGTTSIAAMCCGRNSIGFELNESFLEEFDSRTERVPILSKNLYQERIDTQRDSVWEDNTDFYNEEYEVDVKSPQESDIKFYVPSDVNKDGNEYSVKYKEFEDTCVVDSLGFLNQSRFEEFSR